MTFHYTSVDGSQTFHPSKQLPLLVLLSWPSSPPTHSITHLHTWAPASCKKETRAQARIHTSTRTSEQTEAARHISFSSKIVNTLSIIPSFNHFYHSFTHSFNCIHSFNLHLRLVDHDPLVPAEKYAPW
eukprot:GHVU01035892.1.p1 GENE.GHVU01035892.1~~GHVU01035892.1.p1  ORF type:complete len:129 (+),score=1.20 GHVU01035892.1:325-711(+)